MKKLILGVEIGGTKLQLAIGTFDGEILQINQGKVNPDEGMQCILSWLKAHIPAIIADAKKIGGEISGIGVGFGGPIETETGRVLMSLQISGWKNFEIRRWFEENYSLPVVVFNDSNAACWGEYCCGSGKGTRQFCYMNIGSGLGGGLVINGSLYDGQGYGASEIGQTYVPDWTTDIPGKAQRLELLCSGWSIEKRLRTNGYIPKSSILLQLCNNRPETATCAMLGDAIRLGDLFAQEEVEKIAQSIGIALSNVLSLVNPEKIAVGGGVSKLGDIIIDPIRKFTKQHEFISSVKRYEINKCTLDDNIVLVGAILLLKDFIISKKV